MEHYITLVTESSLIYCLYLKKSCPKFRIQFDGVSVPSKSARLRTGGGNFQHLLLTCANSDLLKSQGQGCQSDYIF